MSANLLPATECTECLRAIRVLLDPQGGGIDLDILKRIPS